MKKIILCAVMMVGLVGVFQGFGGIGFAGVGGRSRHAGIIRGGLVAATRVRNRWQEQGTLLGRPI